MKGIPLECPRIQRMTAPELGFPELNPAFNRESRVGGPADEVKVVRHKEVVAHPPGKSLTAPHIAKGTLNLRIGHPRLPIL
jgi:hypothetical protein